MKSEHYASFSQPVLFFVEQGKCFRDLVVDMAKIKNAGLMVCILALPGTTVAMVESETGSLNDKMVQEYMDLMILKNYAPTAFDVAMDINYQLATQCYEVIPISEMIKSPVTGHLVAVKSLGNPEYYSEQLQDVTCDAVLEQSSEHTQ